MPSDPLVLAFDTSAAHCAAALLSGDRVLALRVEDMARGQAERLMPLLAEVLAEGHARWADLDRIGVGVGPGNFTGIRISVAAARGLALALGVPAIGISTLDAIRADQPGTWPCARPGVPAPRGQVYVETPAGPALVDATTAGATVPPPQPDRLVLAIARLAQAAPSDAPSPAPLYIRAADAAPARDLPPVILDDA